MDACMHACMHAQEQLEIIRRSEVFGGFEFLTMPWKPQAIASAIQNLTDPIDAIVLPQDFVR